MADTNAISSDQFGVEELIKFWETGVGGLPEELKGFLRKPRKTEEVFRGMVENFEEEPLDQALENQLRNEIAEGKTNLNNFWNFFRPQLAQKLYKGEDGPSIVVFGMSPFVINCARDRAWSQMCVELSEEVRTIIHGAQAIDAQTAYDKEEFSKALRKVASYLNQKGVPLLCLYG